MSKNQKNFIPDNSDVIIDGFVNDFGHVEITLTGRNGGISKCDAVIIPGYAYLNNRRRNVALGNLSLEKLKYVKRIHLSKGCIIEWGVPFCQCKMLREITVDPNHELYRSINGVLYDKRLRKLIHFPAVKQGGYVFPPTVTDIDMLTSADIDRHFAIEEIISQQALANLLVSLKINAVSKAERKIREKPINAQSRRTNGRNPISGSNSNSKANNVKPLVDYSRRTDSEYKQIVQSSQTAYNKGVGGTKRNSITGEDIKAFLGTIALYLIPIIIGLMIRSWYDSYKEKSRGDYHVSTVSMPAANINSYTETEDTSSDAHSNIEYYDNSNNMVTYPGYQYIGNTEDVSAGSDNDYWENYYRNSYERLEQSAARDYESLTNLGARYQYDGEYYGATGRDDPYVATQINQFQQLQHEMRNLRFEAAKKGVHISESHWESAHI